MAAVGWPTLVSDAGAGRAKETAEGVHEVVDWDLPHPVRVSGWNRDSFVVRVPTDMVSAVFRKCPTLRLPFVFPSHGPFPAVVQAHLSHGHLALTRLLLEIQEDFLEGWCCVVKTRYLI